MTDLEKAMQFAYHVLLISVEVARRGGRIELGQDDLKAVLRLRSKSEKIGNEVVVFSLCDENAPEKGPDAYIDATNFRVDVTLKHLIRTAPGKTFRVSKADAEAQHDPISFIPKDGTLVVLVDKDQNTPRDFGRTTYVSKDSIVVKQNYATVPHGKH